MKYISVNNINRFNYRLQLGIISLLVLALMMPFALNEELEKVERLG